VGSTPTGGTAIVIWIERTYHRRRRQAALGRLTPIEYAGAEHRTDTPKRIRQLQEVDRRRR
jgi:transposase InsO family protein